MKVIIAGSRTITDQAIVDNAMEEAEFDVTEVVSGRARGVDTLGEYWAIMRNVPIIIFPANWKLYGRSAGILRNQQMSHYADALVAVWDKKSRGTGHMIAAMSELGKPMFVKYV